MPLTDLPLEELRNYRPKIREPIDFDAFWHDTLSDARRAAWEPQLVIADTPISELVIEDLTFAGFAGDPIKAWVIRPSGADGPLPTVIEFIGYNGGRGVPGEKLAWASSGYVHIVMDTRGQGSGWATGGDTADPHGSDTSFPGFMTKGILDPSDYYYRRVFTDAVRLVETASSFEFVDETRVALTGASQGGGISLAAAGLSTGLRAVMPDVPFLCHFKRAIELTPDDPFVEITRFLSVHRDMEERVLHTLSYFDGANFTSRITIPTLFSVGLMDGIVLPSTVFAAYNRLASRDRSIEVFPYNGHEGGQMFHWLTQARWLPSRIA